MATFTKSSTTFANEPSSPKPWTITPGSAGFGDNSPTFGGPPLGTYTESGYVYVQNFGFDLSSLETDDEVVAWAVAELDITIEWSGQAVAEETSFRLIDGNTGIMSYDYVEDPQTSYSAEIGTSETKFYQYRSNTTNSIASQDFGIAIKIKGCIPVGTGYSTWYRTITNVTIKAVLYPVYGPTFSLTPFPQFSFQSIDSMASLTIIRFPMRTLEDAPAEDVTPAVRLVTTDGTVKLPDFTPVNLGAGWYSLMVTQETDYPEVGVLSITAEAEGCRVTQELYVVAGQEEVTVSAVAEDFVMPSDVVSVNGTTFTGTNVPAKLMTYDATTYPHGLPGNLKAVNDVDAAAVHLEQDIEDGYERGTVDADGESGYGCTATTTVFCTTLPTRSDSVEVGTTGLYTGGYARHAIRLEGAAYWKRILKSRTYGTMTEITLAHALPAAPTDGTRVTVGGCLEPEQAEA